MTSLIIWIIFGGLVGWIALIVVGSDRHQGMVDSVAVGVVGGLIGGFFGQLTGIGETTGFRPGSVLISLLGAVVLLGVVRMFSELSNNR